MLGPALATMLLLSVGTTSAQSAPNCAVGQSPSFVFGFAALKDELGDAMGGPIECEHANPENGDTLQQTTTGLAFYRKSTNTPTFTNGSEHWGLTSSGLVFWTGNSIDPPNVTAAPASQPAPSANQDDATYWRRTLAALPVRTMLGNEQPVTTFPRAFRLPPQGAPLTAGLAPSTAWAETNRASAAGAVSYAVVFGTAGDSSVTFAGATGRSAWDEALKAPEGCERFTGSYCAWTFYVSGPPLAERFTDLRVGDLPAMAGHLTCCNGESWSVMWYDPTERATYSISLYLDRAAALGAVGLDPGNVKQARQLADMAATLVQVRLP